MSRLILFFRRPSPQLPTFDMILAECKTLLHFPVMSTNTLLKWCKKLGLCYKRCKKNKEKLVIQQLDVDIVPQACNYIKTETSEQVFLCEFCEFWQPVNLLKTRLLQRCFPLYFAKFLIIVTLQNLCEGLLLTI